MESTIQLYVASHGSAVETQQKGADGANLGVSGVPAAKKVQSTSTSKPLRGAGGHNRRTKTPELLTVKVSAMEALRMSAKHSAGTRKQPGKK